MAVHGEAAERREDVDALRREVRTPRAAGIAGILFSLLFVTAVLLLRRSLNPAFAAPGEPLTDTQARMAVVGLYLMPFAGIAFLWYIAVVRSRIGQMEDQFVATVFLGSGLLFVAMLFTGAAAAGAVVAGRSLGTGALLDAASSNYGHSFGYALLFIYATKAAGVFVLTSSTILRRLAGWPRWMVVMGFVCGLLLLLSVSFWEPILLLFPLWVTVVSIYVLTVDRSGPRT